MKKLVIASIIAAASFMAHAVEVGVTASRDYAGADRNSAGLTIGHTYSFANVTAGAERTSVGSVTQNRYSIVAGRDLVKAGPVTISANAGVAYLDNRGAVDGYAAVVGVRATVPVTQTVSATAGISKQYGQSRVSAYDGNRVTVGLLYKF